MKLYEIKQEILNCIEVEDGMTINAETGEVMDAAKLDALKMDFKDKVRNIACFIKNLDADAKAYKAEADAFTARQKAAEKKRDGLKSYLASVLDGKGMEDTEYKITFRKSKAVEVTDGSKIPLAYWIPQPDKLDKKAVRAALNTNEAVPGVVLVERQNISVN